MGMSVIGKAVDEATKDGALPVDCSLSRHSAMHLGQPSSKRKMPCLHIPVSVIGFSFQTPSQKSPALQGLGGRMGSTWPSLVVGVRHVRISSGISDSDTSGGDLASLDDIPVF